MSSGPPTTAAAESNSVKRASLFSVYSPYVQTAAQCIGILGASIYILGYLVVNAYLAKFGAQSREPFSFTYISAGITLLFLVIVFAAALGYRVATINAQGRAIFEQKPTWAHPIAWYAVSLAGICASLGFGICIASAVTMVFFFRQDNHWLIAALTIYALIDLPLAASGTYRRHPIAGNLFSFVLFVTAVSISAGRVHNDEFKAICWWFAGLGILLLFQFELGSIFEVRGIYRVFAVGLSVLLVAFWYGESLFGRIPQALGGGKPFPVRLLISAQNEATIKNLLPIHDSLSEEVELLNDDSDNVLVILTTNSGSRCVRLSKRLIDGIVPTGTLPSKENPEIRGQTK